MILRSFLTEYGLSWTFNRALYSAKLKMLNLCPKIEFLFEKKVVVKRVDLFHTNNEQISSFIKNLPEDKKEDIIIVADKACMGIITGFSSIELDYGKALDWQLNPLTGKSCDKNKKWYTIPDFDIVRGDVKTIWEASRFTHFITLARAYLLTGNAKYYLAFSDQLNSWLEDNPYSYGVNYKCGQECAIRMMNALLAYSAFKDIVGIKDAHNIKLLVEGCYKKILSNFFYAHKCIKNNHTISELVGMIIGAWCCKDDKTTIKAYKWLDRVIKEQFSDDGGYCQFSFNYQRLALQDIECLLSFGEKTGKRLSKDSLDRVLKSTLLMYQCQNADGDMPNYGSNDGALLFPVSSCGYRDFRPTLNALYTLLTNKRLFPQGIYDEELLWFNISYPQEVDTIDRISSFFPKAGLYTFRNDRLFCMMVLNTYHSRPSHFDQLHIDLWLDGINVFCDTGSYSYASPIGKQLTKTQAHNTAFVNSKEQMNHFGAFMVTDWTKTKKTLFKDCYFEGAYQSANGYSHHRIVELSEGLLCIKDRLSSSNFTVQFHTPCSIIQEKNCLLLLKDGKNVCRIKTDGSISITKSFASRYYLNLEKISLITISPKDNSKHQLETSILYS